MATVKAHSWHDTSFQLLRPFVFSAIFLIVWNWKKHKIELFLLGADCFSDGMTRRKERAERFELQIQRKVNDEKSIRLSVNMWKVVNAKIGKSQWNQDKNSKILIDSNLS